MTDVGLEQFSESWELACCWTPLCPAVAFATVATHARARQRNLRHQSRLLSVFDFLRTGSCEACRKDETLADPFEFAHLRSTGLRDRGRGKLNRIYDVLKHPDAYARLHRSCHRAGRAAEVDR